MVWHCKTSISQLSISLEWCVEWNTPKVHLLWIEVSLYRRLNHWDHTVSQNLSHPSFWWGFCTVWGIPEYNLQFAFKWWKRQVGIHLGNRIYTSPALRPTSIWKDIWKFTLLSGGYGSQFVNWNTKSSFGCWCKRQIEHKRSVKKKKFGPRRLWMCCLWNRFRGDCWTSLLEMPLYNTVLGFTKSKQRNKLTASTNSGVF